MMDGYIKAVLIKYVQINPNKPQLSPHKHCEIQYGSKYRLTPYSDTNTILNETGIKSSEALSAPSSTIVARSKTSYLLASDPSSDSNLLPPSSPTPQLINPLIMLKPTPETSSPTVPVARFLPLTLILDPTKNPKLAVELAPTYFSLIMIPSRASTVRSSPLLKLSRSSCPL